MSHRKSPKPRPSISFDTTSSGVEPRDQTLAVFADPHLYRLASAGEVTVRLLGIDVDVRYPCAAALGLLSAARAHRGLGGAIRSLRHPREWQLVVDRAARVGGLIFPDVVPTKDQVYYWRDLIAPPTQGSKEDYDIVPPVLRAMLDLLPVLVVDRARGLGSLCDDVERDLVDPSLLNLVYADGTYIRQFSDAYWLDESIVPGGLLVNSKAASKDSARIQSVVDRVTKNGARHSGVLHAAAIIPTELGKLVGAVGRSFGGENLLALDLIEPIAAVAGAGLHGVIYDRAVAGWPTSYLMFHYGLPVYHKPVSERAESAEEKASLVDAKKLLARSGIKAGKRSAVVKSVAQRQLDQLDLGELLPLGKSRYTTSQGNVVIVDSRALHLTDGVEHVDHSGVPCTHSLYVDDDSLWDVVTVGGVQRKRLRAVCVDADTVDTGNGHELRGLWVLDCPGGQVEIPLTWTPLGDREAPDDTVRRRRSEGDRALDRLATMSRADDAAMAVHGLRSDVENYFSWVKASYGRGDRACSIDINHQLLDFLACAVLNNALTLRASRYGRP